MSQATGAGAATNRTIDDNYGDSVTGTKPVYSDGWNYGPDCPGCFIQPVVGETFDKSWHDVTVSPSDSAPKNVTLTFTGTAVWVYGIVPNYVAYATTFVNVSFELDGKTAGTFSHIPSTSTDFEYNVTLYSNTALENVQHTLVMAPQRQTNSSYLAFDWAEYTFEDVTTTTSSGTALTTGTTTGAGTSALTTSTGALAPTASAQSAAQRSSSHTSAGAIAGGVVGGIALILLLAIAAFVYHRRRHGGVDKIINIRRGGGIRQSDIEPATHVDPFLDPAMSQTDVRARPAMRPLYQNVRGIRDPSRTSLVTSSNSASAMTSTFFHVTNAAPSTILSSEDDDPSASASSEATRSAAGGGSHKKGASSTSLWVFPADTSREALTVSNPSAPSAPSAPAALTQPTRAAPAPRAAARSRKATMRREELSRQVRDIENAVADLRRRQSSQSARTVLSPGSEHAPPLPTAEDGDAELRRQIESLQMEVERLRAEQDLLLREPPPAYEHGRGRAEEEERGGR